MAGEAVAAATPVFVPCHETIVDLRHFEAISYTVIRWIQATSDKTLTVGVHGNWGARKSSVLRMAEAELKKGLGALPPLRRLALPGLRRCQDRLA